MRKLGYFSLGLTLGIILTIVLIQALTEYNGIVKTFSHFSSNDFKNYQKEEFCLKIQLPNTTDVTEDYIYGDDVLFSSNIQDKSLNYWGYIQIWDIPDLNQFLTTSKLHSTFNFTFYNKQKNMVDSYDCFLMNWSATFNDGHTVLAREYFLKKDQSTKVLRISLFTNKDNFPKQLEDRIISSIKWH